MIPNFNPNKWDREKIIEYVIGDEPLNDQQLAFLVYFDKLQNEKQQLIDFLEDKIKETNNIMEMLEGTGSVRISILQVQLKTIKEILDFIKGDEK